MNEDLDALVPELARLDALIAAEMRRLRARYELSRDEFHGLYITDERVEALLRASQPSPEAVALPDIAGTRYADSTSRWRQLADALELDDDERDLLLVALAPELDAKYETLYAYLNDDVSRRRATVDLAVRLLAHNEEHRRVLKGLLLPVARLFASGLIDVQSAERDQSRGRRPMRLAAPLADWLQGLAYVDERLLAAARFGGVEVTLPDEALPGGAREALDGLVRRLRERAPVPSVVLSAGTAAEAALVAEEVFARAARPVLIVDVAALRASETAAETVSAVNLAQHVLRVGVVVAPVDGWAEADGRAHESWVGALRRLARHSSSFVVAAGPGVSAGSLFPDNPNLDIALPEPTTPERAACWRWALARVPGSPRPPEPLVNALADRFAFGADRVLRAVQYAWNTAMLEGRPRPSTSHLFAAARAASADGSGGTTRVVSTPFDWDDLVLPGDVKTRLSEVVRAIERRSQVLDDWGFARRLGGARGIKVMLAGPSGTGKTMAAGIVARSLHLDLHRIELGTVVSKYIGETEKNLDRAFAAARRANAVLFIDEADALLGKRSQVKDAHDRYANVEIAYLLQKMEDYDGIVIVATNLARNIDEAFSRRMHYVIEFPQPDALARERLWRGMFPDAAPVAADLDFTFLARQFELAGGDIRNVALDSAYCAAEGDGVITLAHVLRAVARQYAKRGQVPTRADFREHYALLMADDAPVGAR